MVLPVSVYGENPTAQVVGVVNMNAYMKRKNVLIKSMNLSR